MSRISTGGSSEPRTWNQSSSPPDLLPRTGRLDQLQLPSRNISSAHSRNLSTPHMMGSTQSAGDMIFSPRAAPQVRDQTAPELDLAMPSQADERSQVGAQPSLFHTPSRSIFSSGPPTSSVSANTAQASMSSPAPVRPSRLLSPSSSVTHHTVHYHQDILATPRRNRLPRVEKDVDDPSGSWDQSNGIEARDVRTPIALSRLFNTPESAAIASRHASYIRTNSGTAYTKATGTDSSNVISHLYSRGLLGGKHSDITIHAFGTAYLLHRLLLDRAPFFSSALCGSWSDSLAREMTLDPADIDANITQHAFELALKRLYGCHVTAEEDKEAIGLFATGCWLDMSDLIDASVSSILRQMNTANVGSIIQLVTTNYYGKHGDRILASAKAMLCREGWEMPLRYWDSVSGHVAKEIIGGDGFFVHGEWERFVLAKKVLDRKLKVHGADAGLLEASGKLRQVPQAAVGLLTARFDAARDQQRSHFLYRQQSGVYDQWLSLYTHPDITALLILLEEGIFYVHLNFEQLQKIRHQRDSLGLLLLPDQVISDALWMQMELRQRIVNAPNGALELGLSQVAQDSRKQDDLLQPEALTGTSRDASHSDTAGARDASVGAQGFVANPGARKFWIPSMDSTSIMGGSADNALHTTQKTTRPYASRLSASLDPVDVQWASDFTASADERPTTDDRNEPTPPVAYTNYPPFRFAAEFPNPRHLKEEKRVYSRTVWYAGSLWNVYIQKLETDKDTQLGVYLHRTKKKDIHKDSHQHQVSSVDERTVQVESLIRHGNRLRRHSRAENQEEEGGTSSGDPDATLVGPDSSGRSTTISSLLRGNQGHVSGHEAASLTRSAPSFSTAHGLLRPLTHSPDRDVGASESDNDDLSYYSSDGPNVNHNVPTLPPYIDTRPTIRTYYKIYSPSRRGKMLSVYECSPDSFNYSQSRGWKSSTMVLDDGPYIGGGMSDTASSENGVSRSENRARFMVVLGNI